MFFLLSTLLLSCVVVALSELLINGKHMAQSGWNGQKQGKTVDLNVKHYHVFSRVVLLNKTTLSKEVIDMTADYLCGSPSYTFAPKVYGIFGTGSEEESRALGT